MDDYADIYYVDGRNATVRDHGTTRTTSPGGWTSGPAGGPANRTVVTPAATASYPAPYAAPYAAPYQVAQPAYGVTGAGYPYTIGYPGQVYPGQMYPGQIPGQPFPGQTALGALFGSMPIGQILELIATAFAALSSLPTAPVATKDTSTDVGNLILYQGALAQHAKRDEQIRTLGALVGKLVA